VEVSDWILLCGGFPYPSSLTEDFTWPLIHCKKNATEQLQTSPDFCDGNWPRTNPYQVALPVFEFCRATLGIDISVNTQCHDMAWPSTEEYWNAKANGSLLFFYIFLPCFLSSIAFKVFLSQAGRHTALRREFFPLSLGSTNRKINENRNHRSARLSSAPEKKVQASFRTSTFVIFCPMLGHYFGWTVQQAAPHKTCANAKLKKYVGATGAGSQHTSQQDLESAEGTKYMIVMDIIRFP
jgi:hypothetical protein